MTTEPDASGSAAAPVDGLTIVIPVYNAADYVAETVRSALADPQVSEVVVVDDGSTDATAKVLASLVPGSQSRLRVVQQTNSGPGAARNAGLRLATTKYVGFVDADDMLLPGWGAAVVRALRAGAAIAVTDAEVIDPSGAVVARYYDECVFPAGNQQEAILRSNFLLSTAAVDRALALAAGGFDERRSRIGVEDWDLWMRIILQGGHVSFVPRILSRYRRGHSSVSSDERRMKRAEIDLLAQVRPTVRGNAGLAAAWRAGRREVRIQQRVLDLRRLLDSAPRRAGPYALSLGWLMHSRRLAAAGLVLPWAPRLGRRLLDDAA